MHQIIQQLLWSKTTRDTRRHKSTLIIGSFNVSLLVARQKVGKNKKRDDLNQKGRSHGYLYISIIYICIYIYVCIQTLHPDNKQYTFKILNNWLWILKMNALPAPLTLAKRGYSLALM